MLELEDLNHDQAAWFRDDFLSGQRHFLDERYPGYLVTTFGIPITRGAESGIVTHMSYLVIDSENQAYSVTCDEDEPASGTVVRSDGTEKIAFMMTNPFLAKLPNVFPLEPFFIAALRKDDRVAMMMLPHQELPHDLPAEAMHAMLTMTAAHHLAEKLDTTINFTRSASAPE